MGSLSKDGLKLYLDGQQVGLRTDVTVGEHLNIGYWRIGGDTVSGWPNAGTNGFFTGSVDEVAVYKHELTPAEIADHYAKGASTPVENLKPVASFTTAVDGFDVTVDGSASTDNDGTISSYDVGLRRWRNRDRCHPAGTHLHDVRHEDRQADRD